MQKLKDVVKGFVHGVGPILIVGLLTLALMGWTLQNWGHPFDNIDPIVARDHWPDPPASEIRAGIPERPASQSQVGVAGTDSTIQGTTARASQKPASGARPSQRK